MEQHYLSPLFDPQSVIVFAKEDGEPTEQSVHAKALLAGFRAQTFRGKVTELSTETTGTLGELAQARADLAIIALPPDEAVAALELAGRIKCKSALVLSAGVGMAKAAEMARIARRHGVMLLGPNSQGFQRPGWLLNASTLGPLAMPGQLALVSQSGALTASILDWARHNKVGFSCVVSVGPHSALRMADMLDFLASDSHTRGLVVYLEGISDARRFMSALRAAAISKPVVILKSGRQIAGNVAAQTHSAAVVGRDAVFDAALRRAGAVRVRSFVELFSAAKCLASRYRPVGKRLAIITNGGGPGVLAADWVSEIGLELGVLSEDTAQALAPKLPPVASLVDLIDVSEDAQPEHYLAALEAAARDKTVDGVLAIYSPKFGSDAQAIADVLAKARPKMSKPLVCCWMGEASVGPARALLADAQIPTFRTPEAAVGAFGNIASFYQNQQLLQQTPPPLTQMAAPDVDGARLLIESVLAERRQALTEMESKALLAAFHIPVTSTIRARSPGEAMMIATQQGYPVALKIDSPDISHKSDVGGVALNLMNATAVRDVYQDMMASVARARPDARINGITVQAMAKVRRGRELYIGVVTDDPFGPVIAFGAGGTMIELMGGNAMELPPLNQFLAHRLIERASVAETLGEWRGASAVNLQALEQVLLRVSEMVCELPQLREMDINPIIVDESGAVAVDARIVVGHAASAGSRAARGRNYSHLSILPYPAHYEQVWPLRGGAEYTVRPIRPGDSQMLQDLTKRLSPESRYFRFVSSMAELPRGMLSRFTLIDYDREMALCAVIKQQIQGEDGRLVMGERFIAVSRYVTNPDHTSCEFSLVVDDEFVGQGLGTRMMHSIMEVARDKGLQEIVGLVLTRNDAMLKLMQSLGFTIKAWPEDMDFRLVTHAL